jgi:hypothetical protein
MSVIAKPHKRRPLSDYRLKRHRNKEYYFFAFLSISKLED